MNKRIQELAEQAAKEVSGNRFSRARYNERFAELIVRECANRLRETDYELMFVEDGMCDPSISDAMLVAASDIEEHFGVE